MKVAIMQPYFAPYIGYISLIKHADLFILFDPVQFIRHGWIERNRMLKQNDGWLYIQVPLVKSGRETLIKDMVIDNTTNWKNKLLAQLQPYKKIAPYYYKVIAILNKVFEQEFNSIVLLNQALLEEILLYLEIVKEIPIYSQLGINIEPPQAADEWALNICKELERQYNAPIHYINPIGGLEFFDKEKYVAQNIQISFQKMNISVYDQKRSNFEPGLSIIDVLMFNSPEEVNRMLDSFELL